jgi:anaerobic ribonucleoside-triphosphate reductase activating protein
MFDTNGEVWLVGIPGRDDFHRLQRLLRETGAKVAISQDGRGRITGGATPE